MFLNRTPPTSPAMLPSKHSDSEPDYSSVSLALDSNVTQRKRNQVDELNNFMGQIKTMFADLVKKQNDKFTVLQKSVNEINKGIQSSLEFLSEKYPFKKGGR